MKSGNRDINVFNLSMLDVISGAMGAFLLVMLVLVPYYGKELREEDVQNARDAMAAAEDNLNRMQRELEQARSDAERVKILTESLIRAQQDLERVQNVQAATMARVQAAARQAQKKMKEAEERLGIALQGHKLVFVIDVSRSMGPPVGHTPPFSDFENSIVAVTAGVKMLVATMDETYRVDIVFFPNTRKNHPDTRMDLDYGYLWGEMRRITEDRKYQVYRFLSELQPYGGTPTEGALDYILDETGYADADAVILLSDGAPTDTRGKLVQGPLVDRLVDRLTSKNNGRFKINTLGVGAGFRNPNASSDAVRFLKALAESNDGFYVGF